MTPMLSIRNQTRACSGVGAQRPTLVALSQRAMLPQSARKWRWAADCRFDRYTNRPKPSVTIPMRNIGIAWTLMV